MVVAGILLCALHGVAAAPVYAGIASRDVALDVQAERMAIAIGQGLDKRGVLDLGSPPLPDAVDGNDAILDDLLSAARNKALEGDFAAAVDKADAAINRFEAAGAFRALGAWSGYADALVVKAVSLRRLGMDAEADVPLQRLATILPKTLPDPGIAPPKVMQRHQQLQDELRSQARVTVELQSEPAGADVVIDGLLRGKTPLVVRDLLPGLHFISLSSEGVRIERKLNIKEGTARVSERVGDARAAAVRALRTAAAAPVAHDVLAAARAVGDDVFFGAVLADQLGPLVVLARARDGALAIVVGARIDKRAPASSLANELVNAVLADGGTGKSVWLGASGPATPEAVLLRGALPAPVAVGQQDAPPDDAAASDGPSWALLAIGAGVTAAAITGAVLGGIVLAAEANKVQVTVDASNLK